MRPKQTQLGKDNSEKNHDVEKKKYDAVLLFRELKLVENDLTIAVTQ